MSCAALCVAHRAAFTAGAAFHAIVAPCRPPHRLIRLSAASAAILIAADEPTVSVARVCRVTQATTRLTRACSSSRASHAPATCAVPPDPFRSTQLMGQSIGCASLMCSQENALWPHTAAWLAGACERVTERGYAMRFDAMKCDAMRCSAIRCSAMRCDGDALRRCCVALRGCSNACVRQVTFSFMVDAEVGCATQRTAPPRRRLGPAGHFDIRC